MQRMPYHSYDGWLFWDTDPVSNQPLGLEGSMLARGSAEREIKKPWMQGFGGSAGRHADRVSVSNARPSDQPAPALPPPRDDCFCIKHVGNHIFD